MHWEKALNKYRRREPHCIIQSETTTAAAIYFVMALTFLYVFDEQHPWVTAVCSALLLGVSVWIMLIYANHSRFESRWEEVRKDIALEKGLADAKEDACGPAAT